MKDMLTKKILTLWFVLFALFPIVGLADNIAENSIVANAQANDEHIVWVKTPINFVVPLNHQRMLSFPDRVEVDNNNPDLTTDKVTIYNNAGTLYVTAHKAFKPILLQVKLMASGEVVLVYLSSSDKAQDNHPLDVVIPSISPSVYNAGQEQEKPTVTINDVSLLRFAAQQFGVKRLASQPNNISRTPMYTHKAVNIYYGDAVEGFPLISWRGGDLYVTAVQLKNTTNQTVQLDPRKLIGHWQAAGFYRFDAMKTLTTPVIPFNTLTPRGTKRDFTLLFVVSDRPFGESLNDLNPFARGAA